MRSNKKGIFHRFTLMLRILFLSLGAVVLIRFLFAVNPMTERIKIGLVAPLSGPIAYLGIEMKQAAIDAVKVINDAGGLLGREIELVVRDDGCNSNRAREIAEKLAGDSQICAVIGHCPSAARDVAEIYDFYKKIFISTFTSNKDFEYRDFNFVFHIGISEDRFGEAAANMIADQHNIEWFQGNNVGIVTDDSQIGGNLADVLEQELKEKNINVKFKRAISNSTDFHHLWEETQPEILFFSVSEPIFISNLLGYNPPPAVLVTVGMPFTPDHLWSSFWSWTDEVRKEALVIAPSVMGGEAVYHTESWAPSFSYLPFSRNPSIPQVYIVTVIDLLVQVINETQSTDATRLSLALRSTEWKTLLGRIRFGETGEINPIPYKLYTGYYLGHKEDYRWMPSTAYIIEHETGAGPPEMRDNGKPEYNIEVEPKESREPLVLIPDEETKVNFWIGSHSDESLTTGIEISDILEAIADGKPLDLTVTLFCDLIETNTYQQQKIRYSPAQRQSNSAKFVIKPSIAAVHDNHGLGKLIFVVDANGMEIDVIQLDAIVGKPTKEALNGYSPPAKLVLDRMLPEEISVPDLIIAFAPTQKTDAVPVVIRPIHGELLAQVREELSNQNEEFWIFDSGVTLDDLRGLVRDSYHILRTQVEQNNKDLQDTYKNIGVNTDLPPMIIPAFEKEVTEKILKVIGDNGADLYWRIFERGVDGLSRSMKAINSFDLDRPLRVRILAENIYAPWQILYSDSTLDLIDPKLFWGFRYELGTLQLVDKAQGRMRTVVSDPLPDEVIFGAWRGLSNTDEKDEVRQRADMLKEHVEGLIGKEIKYFHSKDAFISEIRNRAGSVKLILAYGHGSSGTEIIGYSSDSGGQTVISVPNVIGSYFIFNKGPNDTLIPNDFDRLSRSVSRYDLVPYFLKSQPIVILNACETGASGARTADNNGFVGSLTRMGARAVIVTEAPVWANFAHQFGKDIIDLLLDGKEIRTALLEARLKHLEKAGNPFGLIYSLYGNPASCIKKQ